MNGQRKRIGILTGGGDCPGLNSVIRAVVKTSINIYGYEIIGFTDGYMGLVNNRFKKLALSDVSGLLDKGGTILGTTDSFDPFKMVVDNDGEKQERDMSGRIIDNLKMHNIECLIVIGGINTITTGYRLSLKGVKVIAIPKNIDNDIPGTDATIGFISAVNTATDALDKLHSSAESHHRLMLLEVMGRRAGWVALESGIAGGADIILIPEIPYDINLVARKILERKRTGKNFSIICVSEGAVAAKGSEYIDDSCPEYTNQMYGVSSRIAAQLEKLTHLESRVTVLGYLQRGGEPSPTDRILSTRLGVEAVKMAAEGIYNKMAGIVNNELCPIDLTEVANKCKHVPVDGELVRIARNMGVSFGD
ncbi:MAG: 6-phosphofructokinase [Clostridiaceae bacterium]|jgi:phosphofructokinase-like protein|nr:6-phosphofructokinase [Clostridiaceae bacterium]